MNNETTTELMGRIHKLGIPCEHAPATHRVDPAIAAIACFPMHMVAGASVLIDSTDEDRSKFKDLFNIAAVRAALVVGEQEIALAVSTADRETLNGMLAFHRPADIIIYEYALDTLNLYFTMANADVVELLKTTVARSVVAVSKAAGEGWFGRGSTPSEDQRACIDAICLRLKLGESKTAAAVLEEINSLDAT
jgi:hypothetical protein